MPEPTLGLIMILRNEQHNLPRSLAPVAGCFDEVVVADTGSSDHTAQMARDMGARVYDHRWGHDFAEARNFTISKAKADWLFWLDGDNAIGPNDVAALRRALPAEGPMVLWALERVVPGGEQLWQKRCFPNRPEVRFQGRVHEQLVHPSNWPQKATPVVVLHWGYQDKQRLAEKGRYYQGLLEQMLADDPEDFYAHFQLARCRLNQREFALARRELEQVVGSGKAREINRELWAHSHYLLAQVLDRQGEPDRAEALFEQLLEQMPGHGLTLYQAGRLAYSHRDWLAAADYLGRAIAAGIGAPVVDAEPDKIMFLAYFFLGRSLAAQGRHAEAIAALGQATGRDPDNLAARTALAESLLACGDRAGARRELAHALALRPDDRRAARLMAAAERAA